MSHKLSIIVVVLNEASQITRLKRAIDAQTRIDDVSIETILIDGGSKDNTPEIAKAAGFSKVIIQPGASIPVCRNRGLHEASGDWIAFLDGDCEPSPHWLDSALSFLRAHKALIIGWPVEPSASASWIPKAWHFHWTHKNLPMVLHQGCPVILEEAYRLITTRNMLLTREVIEKTGPFREDLETGEDTDFVFRAYSRGISVIGAPMLRVIHHGEPSSLSSFFRQQLWHSNRRAYKAIFSSNPSTGGRHAPLYTLIFAVALMAFGAAAPLGLLIHPFAFFLLIFMPMLLASLALRTSLRGGNTLLFFQLCILYFLYGLARSLDLAGLDSRKKSWKS